MEREKRGGRRGGEKEGKGGRGKGSAQKNEKTQSEGKEASEFRVCGLLLSLSSLWIRLSLSPLSSSSSLPSPSQVLSTLSLFLPTSFQFWGKVSACDLCPMATSAAIQSSVLVWQHSGSSGKSSLFFSHSHTHPTPLLNSLTLPSSFSHLSLPLPLSSLPFSLSLFSPASRYCRNISSISRK